jgi:hypothetical protein
MVMVDYEYTEPSLVQAELRASTAFSSSTTPSLTQVQQWIVEASDVINQLSGTVWGVTTYTQYFDYEGQEVLYVRHSPLKSVVSLKYNKNPLGSESGEDWETKTEDSHFTVYEKTGEVVLLLNRFAPGDGRKRIEVVYKAGYSEVPARVQLLCTKMVAQRVLESLISSNVNSGNDGGSVSVGSISITEPASYGVNSYNNLKREIKELQQSLLMGSGAFRYG